MPYPTGFRRGVLWGAALLLCVWSAVALQGLGLAVDWIILSILAYWHFLATRDDKA